MVDIQVSKTSTHWRCFGFVFAVHCMSSACNFHRNMIFYLGNMWIQVIKHLNWQLFTITDKGILGPGNSQIAPLDPIWGAYSTPYPLPPHNLQLQSHIFHYAQDAPKCPKLLVMEACPQFLDYSQRTWKKENVEITGVNYKRSGISRGVQGKTCGISIGLGFWP